MKDRIMQQVWRAKDAVAKKYGYDVRVMAKELQRREHASGIPVVNLRDHAGRICEEPPEYKTKPPETE